MAHSIYALDQTIEPGGRVSGHGVPEFDSRRVAERAFSAGPNVHLPWCGRVFGIRLDLRATLDCRSYCSGLFFGVARGLSLPGFASLLVSLAGHWRGPDSSSIVLGSAREHTPGLSREGAA